MDKEKLESAILALEDIKKALELEEPVDSFITHWEKAQYVKPEIPSVYECVRMVYAEQIGEALKILNNLK